MADQELLAEILGELHERERNGERIDLYALVREHPDLEDELRAHVEALDLIDGSFEDGCASDDGLPEKIGDYRIERELGRGGMGTVYLARGSDDQAVALKVIHAHLLERRGFFKRFLREAQFGARVRHENVVRTLDVDAVQVGERTVHFLVMEHVQGKTLRSLGGELGVVPEALLREIAQQAAAGLAAIHDGGIVHRDLKPENLLITDDHRVRIMDLGVARPIQATLALTQEGQFAGSLLYAAPEQFEKAEVGPAADLYALGVLLYELATGENPFRADQVAAVLKAHLELVPARIEERVPEVSPFFSEVVATLLEKKPEARVASARALADLLEQGEDTTWWSERERQVARARQRVPVVPVRRETKLYGRVDDLALIRDTWDRAREGRGNTILLEGEAGVGKSRLVDACLQELTEPDAQVLYGSYPPAGGMGAISEAFLGRFGSRELEEGLGPYLKAAPSLTPGLATLLKHESPPPGSPSLSGDALHAACVHVMRALATEKPLVWVVEDLHFAGRDGRQLALSLARAVEGHPILLILTSRPGLPEEELVHFGRLENFQRVTLARLGARDVVLLLKDAFRSERLAEKLGGKIALKSDGVPFFVFEMIRGLMEGQFLEVLPDGSWVESKVIDEIAVPSAVKDLIEVRLGSLSDEERAILDVGAVQGFEFDPHLVARVLESKRVHVLQQLAAIQRRSGVVHATNRNFRFDHHQIQEVVHADLPQALKEEYDTLLAEAYAKRCRSRLSGEDHVFLSSHLLRGIHPSDSLDHLVPALEFLRQTGRNEAAADLGAQALKIPGLLEGDTRARVHLLCFLAHSERGERKQALESVRAAQALEDRVEDRSLRTEVWSRLGEHLCLVGAAKEALPPLKRASELARSSGDAFNEAAVSAQLARVLRTLGRPAESDGHLAAAARYFAEADASVASTDLHYRLGAAFWDAGRFAESRSHFTRARHGARTVGNVGAEARATTGVGLVLKLRGRHKSARTFFERAVSLARQAGARGDQAAALGNLGNLEQSRFRFESAREYLERAIALDRETGSREQEAVHAWTLGVVLDGQGCYAEALAYSEKATAFARDTPAPRFQAWCKALTGRLAALMGRFRLAQDCCADALALGRRAEDTPVQNYATKTLASVQESLGDLHGARELCENLAASERDSGSESSLADSLWTLGRIELELGELEPAVARFREARDLAHSAGDRRTDALAEMSLAAAFHSDGDGALMQPDRVTAQATHDEKMLTLIRAWEFTRDYAYLKEAKRLLDFAVAHTPAEYRESMLKNVRLNREIMEAWAEHGGGEQREAPDPA